MSDGESILMRSVIFMCISLGIMALAPIAYMVVAWIRKKASVSSAFLGILGFGLGFCTYGLIWCLYVVIVSGGFVTTDLSMSYYMVYAVLAGVCPVLWMYLLLKKHRRKHGRPWDGMCLYAGFSFANAVKLSLPIVDNVRLCVLCNRLGLTALQESMGEREAKLAVEKLYQVSRKESSYFLIDGLEAVLLLVIFLSMGYLLDVLLKSGKRSVRVLLFLLLAVIQMMTELPGQLLRTTLLEIEGKEMILAGVACVAAGAALITLWKKKQGENA